MFDTLKKIRKNRKRILGLNERYLEYIRPSNLSNAFAIADDKVETKRILEEHDIPVPNLLGTISSHDELDQFDFDSLPKSFVMKPVHGTRGAGVEIFYNRDKQGNWIQGNGRKYSVQSIQSLARDILDGKYSLHNEPDIVLIEERVKPHKAFRYHTYKGTPDVRIIVYNNVPVMGMLRLPTERSGGKANLDQGAIGAGIDISAGKTTTGIYGKSGRVEKIPSTKLPVAGLRIPYWNRILEYSLEAASIAGLGFAGIDFLIDKERGPVIIELNARSGLSIQLANQAGLRARLRKASGIKVKSSKHGIRLAKDLFGGEIEEGIETLSGKNVIGIYENITLFGTNGETYKGKAKIDTGADSTSIDKQIATKLGFGEIVQLIDKLEYNESMSKSERKIFEEELQNKLTPQFEQLADIQFVRSSHGLSLRPYIKINLEIDDTKFETKASIYDRSKLSYPIIVGRKSLTKFLVDPSKKS